MRKQKRRISYGWGYFGQHHFNVSSNIPYDYVLSTIEARYDAIPIEDSVCGSLTLNKCLSVIGSEHDKDVDLRNIIELEYLRKQIVLGEGQFGIVWLVTNAMASESKPYALKIKLLCEEKNARKKMMQKNSVVRKLQEPFLVNLVNTYGL